MVGNSFGLRRGKLSAREVRAAPPAAKHKRNYWTLTSIMRQLDWPCQHQSPGSLNHFGVQTITEQLTMHRIVSNQYFRKRAGALLEGRYRTTKLPQDGQVEIGGGLLVSIPFHVLAVLEAQLLPAGQ